MSRHLAIAALALAASSFGSAAEAKGCVEGALVGGLAGHAAGHTFTGTAAGCAIGHHFANKKDTTAQANPQQPAR